MAYWGLEVKDENGKVLLDSDKLLHRLWHKGVYTADGSYYYATPLDHEPTIVTVSMTTTGLAPAATYTHITSGGLYTGFRLAFGPSSYRAGKTQVLAFARR